VSRGRETIVPRRTTSQDHATSDETLHSGQNRPEPSGPSLDEAKLPEAPTDLPRRSWLEVVKRTFREFQKDNLTDWAAALTYYGVLSLFPGIILLTALLGMLGHSATQSLIDSLNAVGPGAVRDLLVNAIRDAHHFAGPLAIVGLIGALWSASGYLGAFVRASNAIYDVAEGRPLWKTLLLRIVLTVTLVVLLAACAVGLVFTGSLATKAGHLLGIGSAGITVWNIAKWPVMVLLISLAIALLYWRAPNVRQPSFRWFSPGSLLAVVLWAAASAGFAFYVGNFGSYNRTYGSLAAVIVFLVWLWISNLAVLLGAEFDAELARGRQIVAGASPEAEPFLPPRDTRSIPDGQDATSAPELGADR
jgi:membrane protein